MEKINNIDRDAVKFTSFYHDAFQKIKKDKLAILCIAFIFLLIIVAVFAPIIAPFDQSYQDTKNILKGPSSVHLLGTDEFGRDILSRIIYGTRVSLAVGVVAEAIAVTIGVVMGAMAGYYGGRVDAIISRIIEIFASFPQILFAIVIMFVLGTGVINVFFAIGFVGWTSVARVIRSQVIQLKENEYVEAAKASGGINYQIILRHMIPNCLSTIIVIVTMEIPADIMYEASLSFLGLGVQPPDSSWGQMISTARMHLRVNPSYAIFPGIALVLTVLAFNLLGDALRDALDPRLKNL
ncbi:ABC transporter permease [Anaerosphaera multitolerans]|uniref:ABC transporter permease n=1 Tax=Anaerosphaera multitolerans TaxID=2487351 RepID=A0A437S606_9FIRM|nr:ABC transporter permease [Anaerosphaera multitolerans]RVU54407.1 ABC transporter permease [Anaerosphaera multitolerans]